MKHSDFSLDLANRICEVNPTALLNSISYWGREVIMILAINFNQIYKNASYYLMAMTMKKVNRKNICLYYSIRRDIVKNFDCPEPLQDRILSTTKLCVVEQYMLVLYYCFFVFFRVKNIAFSARITKAALQIEFSFCLYWG